jgi:hypothetical protein
MINTKRRQSRKSKRSNGQKNQNNNHNSQVAKIVERLFPMKVVDTRDVFNVTSGGLVQQITFPVNQGTANGQRLGDEIRIRKIEFRRLYEFGDPSGNTIRTILFQLAGPYNLSTISDILSSGGSGSPDVTSFIVPSYKGNSLKVILDETIDLSDAGSNQHVSKRSTHLVPWKTIAFPPGSINVDNGSLVLLFVSDSGIVPHPTVQCTVRMYYQDI